MSLLPYARLLRVPNVFTAFADIALGAAVSFALSADAPVGRLALLALASGCLYLAGMAWNDYFDYAEDLRDRPFRPLPAGQIRRSTAAAIGAALLAAGVGLAALAGGTPSLVIASILAGMILLYDARAKRGPLGPLAMGTCRLLNVLLGLSLLDPAAVPWGVRLHLAAAVGVYIVGVTWFARTEAAVSRRGELAGAAGVMLAGVGLALGVPAHFPEGATPAVFPYAVAAFVILVGGPVVAALRDPGPKPVQRAIKRCVLGLVALDAALATAFVGTPGLAVLLLLPPALVVGKWVYST